jgi:uncharacterized protein (TIGR02266 family)
MGKKSKKQRAKARQKQTSAAPSVAPAPASLAPAAQVESAVVAVARPAEEAPFAAAASSESRVVASAPAEAPVEVEEHRASKRISIEVELHLASDSHFFSGLSGDISEGGVFVSTYRALAQGSLVDLEFSLPGAAQPLHARGEVRWHRDATPHGPPGVGISFDKLSEDDREIIHRFCTMRPPLYYDDVG